MTNAYNVDLTPVPLVAQTVIPDFPVDALPAWAADYVLALAEATQTDPAMPATSALTALAACVGGRVEIEPRPGWQEPLNLYTATVAGPGERKSAVQQAITRPLFDVEKKLVEQVGAIRLEALTRKEIAEETARRDRAEAAKVKTNKDKALADAIGSAAAADQIEVPELPRLIADDATPEAIGSLLAEQHGRLAVISAEGGVFDIMAGRYSNMPNLDIWLKGHAGDQLRIDRKGRPPELIPRPALTLGLMIQREVLTSIAGRNQFRGRGLLARFLYSFPKSYVGNRNFASTPVSEATQGAYRERLGELAERFYRLGGADVPAVLSMTPSGQRAIELQGAAVERMLAADGELGLLTDWGAKYVGAVARIAGVVHLANHGPEGVGLPVDATTVLAATRIGNYYKASAIRAFGTEMGMDQVTADAVYLLGRIKDLGKEVFTGRDLIRKARRFKTVADMTPAVERLIDHGYLMGLPALLGDAVTGAKGGRPAAARYTVVHGALENA